MKSNRKPLFAILGGIFISFQTFAQETDCNDGIDNDSNGYVDCYDTVCSGEGSCEEFFVGNEIVCQEEPTDNPTFAMRLQWGSADETANSHAQPAVGDIDQDGTPEVIVTNKHDKSFSILDGVFGGFDTNLPGPNGAGRIDLGFQPENAVALGDFDGNGYSSIIISEDKNKKIERWEYDEDLGYVNEVWSVSMSDRIGLVGIADFNEDGTGEIYFRDVILNADDGSIISGTNGGD